MPNDIIALEGSELNPLPGSRAIGRPNPARVITVTVVLRPRRAARELHSRVAELSRHPPGEREHLSRRNFAAEYRADPAQADIVRRFARRNGLRVIERRGIASSPHAIELRGPIGAFSRAFRVDLRLFEHPRRTYRGRTGPIHIPAALQEIVQAVIGLDNRPVARPHFRRLPNLGGGWLHAAVTNVTYTPTQLAKLYNFPTDVNGSGQTIAIVELGGGYRPTDLSQYFAAIGVSPAPHVSAVSVNGGTNSPSGPNGPDGEVMLDIEVAGAIAPGANIVVYFAPNTNRGFLSAINAAIHDNVNAPSVVSISWGGPEASWTAQTMNAFDQAFQAAALMGVTVCVAAGDGGSTDGVSDGRLHADFPASSPHVIACGGTRLVAQPQTDTVQSEVVWNDGANGGATGGGISQFFALPTWQSGAHVPPSGNVGHHVGRGLPDIAANADPVTGYQVRVDGSDLVIGGTSAVAPLWAGLIALVNQSLAKSVGYLNPSIYQQLASRSGLFRDITAGNNDNTHLGLGYSAAAGCDPCSGWGAVDGSGLVAALKGGVPAAAEARPPAAAQRGGRSGASSASEA